MEIEGPIFLSHLKLYVSLTNLYILPICLFKITTEMKCKKLPQPTKEIIVYYYLQLRFNNNESPK
jgi:hypothetical protein